MEYRRIPHSNLEVSKICLGTMTWGEQNTQAEAFAQLDYAIGNGINFIDTAEMYPVPPKPETQGETERILGQYIKAHGNRDDLVIATKIAAPVVRVIIFARIWRWTGTISTKRSMPP